MSEAREVDYMSLIDAERSRLKGEIRVLTRERDDARRQALLFVADDLRRAAEAHLKSAAIEGRRLYRKHLADTAHVLIERATFYEQQSQDDTQEP
jgi:uncharacterized protein YbjQ (UPF0145 family)